MNNEYKCPYCGHTKTVKNKLFSNWLSVRRHSVKCKLNDGSYLITDSGPAKVSISCLFCSKELTIKANKFCNSSCSASFNNKRKAPRTAESKLKTALAVCKTLNIEHITKDYSDNTPVVDSYLSAIKRGVPFTKVKQCTYCKKWFNFSKRQTTTCSDSCYISVKTVLNAGIHKQSYNGVIFDSGWEVVIAKQLDNLQIEWTRPTEAIEWVDYEGKSRKYFPDFYLPRYDVFLDPKNPIAIQKQLEKVTFLKESYTNIVIGYLDDIY